jgi:hypothetical protein
VIVTFYSYKGGVGRSMALVNVGEILADVGYDVIVCDFDLEAPGLERYVTDNMAAAATLQANRGVIDLLEEYKRTLSTPGKPVAGGKPEPGFTIVNGLSLRRPSSCAVPVGSPNAGRRGQLRLLGAGRRDEQYAALYSEAVQQLNWSDFYKRWAGAAYIDFFRTDLSGPERIVLIDSRTGVTEHGGICTYHLADLVVLLSAPNDINIEGTKWMTNVLTDAGLGDLRNGRPLQVMPVAARVEIASQAEELAQFRERFEAEFAATVPTAAGDARTFIQDSEIPYIPYFAFSEKVVARQSGTAHRELYRAYETVAQAIVGVGRSRELLRAPKRRGWLDTGRMGRAEPTLGSILQQHKLWVESGHTAGRRADLRGQDLSLTELTGADLREADLTEANLEQSDLREADLSEAELTGAMLRGAKLQGARLTRAGLNGADLTRAVLTGAILEHTQLDGANLEAASLAGARLRFASLRRTRLIRANLESCDLRDSDLEEAALLGADLRSADLTGAHNIDREKLEQAQVIQDDRTLVDQPQRRESPARAPALRAGSRASRWLPILPAHAQAEFPALADDFRFLEEYVDPYYREVCEQAYERSRQYRYRRLVMAALIICTLLSSLAAIANLMVTGSVPYLELIIVPVVAIAGSAMFTAGPDGTRDGSRGYWQKAERLRREYFIFLGQLGDYADTRQRRDCLIRNVQAIMSEVSHYGG